MKYLIIGASSGLGREIAYEYARNKHDLILVSRDLRDLTAIKSDLEKQSEIKVEILELDLNSESEIEKNLFVEKFFNDVQGILFPIGMMFDDDKIELNQEKIEKDMLHDFSGQRTDIDWHKLKTIKPYKQEVIKDEEFLFGRKTELGYIYNSIFNLEKCFINGQKRIGKTSFARVIESKLKSDNIESW